MTDGLFGILGVKAQDKFVYIRWFWFSQTCRDRYMSISELASEFQLNFSMVKSCVARLYENGYVTMLQPHHHFRDQGYALVSKKNPLVIFNSAKNSYVRSLLGVDENLKNCRAEELARRLLKAQLVVLSDDIGLVLNVSLSKLANSTGLSIQRIRRYKDEFLDEGFMLNFISGGNAPNTYPRCKAIFILDPSYFGGGFIKIKKFPEKKFFGFTVREIVDNALRRRIRIEGSVTLESIITA
ncbi:MAG: hypothetical protein ACTIMT_06115 [Marinomonadaceae bacterium]